MGILMFYYNMVQEKGQQKENEFIGNREEKMEYNYVIGQYGLHPDALLRFGFIRAAEAYVYRYPLYKGEYTLCVKITDNCFSVCVYDTTTGDLYLPFFTGHSGGFAARMRQQAAQQVERIIRECFLCYSMREKILNYVKNQYGTQAQYLWKEKERDQLSCVLRTPVSGKWYGVLMQVPARCLGMDRDTPVDILNVKGDPEDILNKVDHIRYFPAYHMNKKHWLTILLEGVIAEEFVFPLLDRSFFLTEKKNGKERGKA